MCAPTILRLGDEYLILRLSVAYLHVVLHIREISRCKQPFQELVCNFCIVHVAAREENVTLLLLASKTLSKIFENFILKYLFLVLIIIQYNTTLNSFE